MEAIRNACRLLGGNPERKNSENLGVDKRIILKRVLGK
jgi:hypothetical protein